MLTDSCGFSFSSSTHSRSVREIQIFRQQWEATSERKTECQKWKSTQSKTKIKTKEGITNEENRYAKHSCILQPKCITSYYLIENMPLAPNTQALTNFSLSLLCLIINICAIYVELLRLFVTFNKSPEKVCIYVYERKVNGICSPCAGIQLKCVSINHLKI